MSGFFNTVPPPLAPHISNLSQYCLVLVTYVVGASPNWLLLRLLHASLNPNPTPTEAPSGVILISFLRDYAFWRDAARKSGLDLARLAAQNRFVFIDGLSELFSSGHGSKPGVKDGHVVLRDAKLKAVESAVSELIGRMNAATGRTVLLVDGLDFVMAAGEETAGNVEDMVMEWRQHVYSIAITASADSPLIHSSRTPLETNHLAHVVGLAHQSSMVMGLRLLDSGTAKDVSGVLRISRGAQADDDVAEAEFLYLVGGDGGVKVFERGA